jgi:hypothetical protein
MMFRDEDTETQHKRLPDAQREPSDQAAPQESPESNHRMRPQSQPILRPGPVRPQGTPRPLQISNGTKRIPSYPDWEKAPSAFEYPRLRGQEVHRPLKPLLFAAIGVALIAGVILAFSYLTGHGGGVAAVSGSARPSASQSGNASPASPVISGSHSVSPTPTASPASPRPTGSFQQYLVKAGDSATKIANHFGLKTWELIAANPQLVGPNYNVRVNSFLNIPLPGQMAPPTPTPTPVPTPTPTPTIAAP